MKKEMFILVDTLNEFSKEFEGSDYKTEKENTVGDFPDVDEYDLGYANGYTKAVYKTAKMIAFDEVAEFTELISNEASPLDVVTVNSSFSSSTDETDAEVDDDEEYEGELDIIEEDD